jgi:curved DNA-binding protein CbpA
MSKKYFVNCQTLEELKKEYKKLAMMYHPDRPNGDTRIMQEINAEYEIVFNVLKEREERASGKINNESVNEYKDIIDQLIKFDTITVSVVGSWIWVENVLKTDKEIHAVLKANKFFYNGKRNIWQRKPSTDTEKHRYSKESDEQIKSRLGCQTIKSGATKKSNQFVLV